MHRRHEAFDDLPKVLELVKEDTLPEGDGYKVRGLKVIYGEQLEFEPATVVETYRVKEPA